MTRGRGTGEAGGGNPSRGEGETLAPGEPGAPACCPLPGEPSRCPAPWGLVLPQLCEGIPVELPLLQAGKLRDGGVPWGRPGPDSGQPGARAPAPWAPPETPRGPASPGRAGSLATGRLGRERLRCKKPLPAEATESGHRVVSSPSSQTGTSDCPSPPTALSGVQAAVFQLLSRVPLFATP